MHSLAATFAPVLAAEKSKVPFYIAGGLLVAWALIVSLGLGLRDERFPGNLRGQRVVMAISAVLALGAVTTAVLTAGGEGNKLSAAQDRYPIPPTAPEPGAVEAAVSGPAAPSAPSEPSPGAGAAPSKAPSSSTSSTATAPPSRAVTTTLKLAADPTGQLAYNTKTLSSKAGNITITMTNSSPVEHDVTIAQGTTVLGKTPTFAGGARSLSLKLKPGTYTFYCSVPGHRQAGMEGTLTVS
jgi:uncharacterized cupredoxin-like copper-binding protein